jgi:hypothetical protein
MGCLLGLSCCERVTIPTKLNPLVLAFWRWRFGVGVVPRESSPPIGRRSPRFSYHAARLSCPRSGPQAAQPVDRIQSVARRRHAPSACWRLDCASWRTAVLSCSRPWFSPPAALPRQPLRLRGTARHSLFEERVGYQNSSARTFRASRSSTALTIPVSVLSTNAWATSTYSETTTRAGTSVRFSSS